MKAIHFVSGLPRSGSTLLGAILNQNPALVAGMSSPVASLINGLSPRLSGANEFNLFIDPAKRERLLRGIFENYYEDQPDRIIIDTNRHWTAKLPMLIDLFPHTRLICCVRPITAIIQSFERIIATNPLELSRVINFDTDSNVYTRSDMMMSGLGVVGLPLNGLKEAFYGPNSDRLMVVDYRRLASSPGEVLAAIYEFIGLPSFAHRFDALEYHADDYDLQLGLPGLHKIKPEVRFDPPMLTLPPDIINTLAGPYFWEDPGQPTRANVSMARL